MRIAFAQIDTTVGAFEANAAKVRAYTQRAKSMGADLVLFPELCLTGYPPKDFLELPDFLSKAEAALADLARPAPWSEGIAVYLGSARPHSGPGTGVHNAGVLLGGGNPAITAAKMLLPTYDVFDEGRYFDPADQPTVAELSGTPIGLSICEDIWNDKLFWTRRRYARDPIEEMAARGARLILNISASPYAQGKPALRERMLSASAKRHRAAIAYLNLVGGNDSLVFDGHSALFSAEGEVLARAPGFREDLMVAELGKPGPLAPLETELDGLLEALVLGVRDYAEKTGFQGAVVGLSGGVDSALTALIAARAFGPQRVRGVAMPSRYTADMSTEDARALAKNLGIPFEVIPIEPVFKTYLESLRPSFDGLAPDVTEENLQARIRGALLMALSNKLGLLLLSTGNKSELAVGYCTLYGDMAGGLAVIGDVPKTLVYKLAHHVNEKGTVIPERTLTRPPSAELRPNQTDQDSLPPYDELDAILGAYIEEHRSLDQIVESGHARPTVERVLRMVERSEYKRRQAAPTLRVSPKAFGEGWRFPIAQAFKR